VVFGQQGYMLEKIGLFLYYWYSKYSYLWSARKKHKLRFYTQQK
jgi:hypothetical protein